MILMKFAV